MQLKTVNKALSAKVPGVQLYFADSQHKNMFLRVTSGSTHNDIVTDVPWLNRKTVDEWVAYAQDRSAPAVRLKAVPPPATKQPTRDELRQIAKSMGIKGYGRMTVSQLLKTVAVDA